MKLFIKNIERSINEVTLESLFAPYGEIVSTKIVYDRITWQSRGFGFIEFEKRADAQKAIEALQGRELKGKAIEISEAIEKR
ncbi:MAG: RNA-binding protein [Bacteroidia bacterium]|nr:RNA-binding protein [Bacteroidia bacterium]